VPTYQYACTECGHAFEQVQSFTDDALTTCPECSGRLRKVFNAVGVVFKGSGFYRTDSRAGSSSGASGSSTSSGSSSASESSGGSGSSSPGSSGSGDSGSTSPAPAASASSD
jgi:putative FmdB family regulatory protein